MPSPQVTPDDNGHHPIYGYGELSATNVLDTLVPPEDTDTEPGGCGCQSGPPAGILPWALGLLVLAARRRRR